MDRLISERAVIESIEFFQMNPQHFDFVNLIDDIKEIPSAEPYKGMTNGQVHDMLYQMLVELKDGADRYGAEKWWNSPYKGVAIPSAEPCEDAISREKLLKAIDTWDEFGCDADTKLVPFIHDVVKCIQCMPSVKPQEPKTGHWIDNHNNTISCDHCHTWFKKDDRYGYMHYCPYCNTKMVEPHERIDKE